MKIGLKKVFEGMQRAELEQELSQCSDQLVGMQEKIDSLEKDLAEEKAHSKKIIENAVGLMVHGCLCEKHRAQVQEMSFDAFVEKQNKDGCPWCSVERVAYLEGILNADGSFSRCHDCGAYVHERDNDWARYDGMEICDECEEKRQDADWENEHG